MIEQHHRPSGSLAGSAWPAGLVSQDDHERFRRYEEARAFFTGEQWTGKRRSGEVRMTFNYARTLVRKVSSYVFPAPVTFAVQDSGDLDSANRAEQQLQEAIAQNDLSGLDFDLSVEAAVIGDAAVKVTWDARRQLPMVAAVDPATLVVQTRSDDPKRVLQVAQRYLLPGQQIEHLFTEQTSLRLIDLNRTYAVTEIWSDDRWRVSVDHDEVVDRANPYGWIPYVIAPNNPVAHQFWGTSDLVDLFDVCRELNVRMSVLSQILALSGAPVTVLENVDGSEGIVVGPGAKWELPEGARAYLLDLLSHGGMRLHIEYVDLLYRTLHDLSETPRTAFGDSGRTLSGAALEVEIQPLVQKVARKRRQWDSFYLERNARLLDLLERFGGHDFGGLRRTAPIWPGVLPSDRDGTVRNTVALVEAGIRSRRSAIADLGGIDPDGELDRIRQESMSIA